MRSNNLYNTLPKERLISHGCNQWPKSSNWCFVIEEGGMKSELGTLMNIISLRGGAALYNECVHATRSLGGNFPKQNSKFLLIVFFSSMQSFIDWYDISLTSPNFDILTSHQSYCIDWTFLPVKQFQDIMKNIWNKNIGLLLNFVAKY